MQIEQSERKYDYWNITGKRFVAFFDILGFKDKVMRDSHDEIYEKLAEIQVNENLLKQTLDDPAVQEVFQDYGIYVVKFSDSISLFSKNDTIENFVLFLISARFLFTSFLKKEFLIKGGMAYGKISLDKEKQLYFGQPIIDAYNLEEDVNYIGVIAHNSIDEFKQNIDKNNKFCTLLNQLIFEAKSPLKSGFITHLNLNWFRQFVDNENLNGKMKNAIKSAIITELKKYYLGVAGSPRRYIDNTIEFLEKNESNINFDEIIVPSE